MRANTCEKSEETVDPEIMEDLARRYYGNDVLCLHALAQPLVSEMQSVIRWQKEIIERECEAIRYVLERMRRERGLRDLIGAGTEAFERLTAQVADAMGQDVDAVRDYYLPGSAVLHRPRREEA